MLLKLPNELAFQIFGDLDNAALLALAKSCRHLNIIATSYYLSCHDMSDPSHKIYLWLEKDFGHLPFLRVSTLLTSSRHLLIRLTGGNYLDRIHGSEGLLIKLSSVKTVLLSLPFVCNHQDEARFVKATRDLLTTVISRSCETLRISSGPNLTHSHHTIEQKLPRIGLSKLSRIFIAPFKKVLQKSSATANIGDNTSPHHFPTSKLTKLQINSGTLFDSPFLHWTIHLINTSPITFLDIQNLYRKPFPWDHLLSTIHSPALSELHIADNFNQLPCSSVAAFLARHQTITSLLCRGLSQDGPNYPKFFLPQLTDLVSNPPSIVYLLEDVTVFPSLRNITLHTDYLPFDPSIMNNALECVSRCPNELELTLKVGGEDEAFISWLDVDVNDNGRVERLLHRVIRLTLPVYPFSTKTLLVLPKWLALFPSLRLLTFQHYKTIPRDVTHSVIQACPQLETLTINEESHTIATWLAKD